MLPADSLCRRAFLLLLLLATASRFYGLDRLGLWADELWVVMDSAQGSLWDVLRTVHYQDNHPPGYYLLSRISQQILGSSDWAIRLPSALAGVALVWSTFRFGQKFFSMTAGLIAAALVAGSWQGIYFSQEARPNIFLALFCLLALHTFLLTLQDRASTRQCPWTFWLWGSLAAYFHYAGLVFIASLGLIGLGYALWSHNRSVWRIGLTLFLPLLLLYLPWLPGLYHDLTASPPEAWQRTPNLRTLAQTFLYLFGPGDLRVLFYAAAALAATFIGVVTALNSRWRQTWGPALLPFLCLCFAMVLPVALFYLKSVLSQSAYNYRHFLFAVPLLSLLAGAVMAAGLRHTLPRHATPATLITLAAILLYQLLANWQYGLYRSNHFKQDYRESAQYTAGIPDLSVAPHPLLVSNVRFFDHYLQLASSGRLKTDLVLMESTPFAQLAETLVRQQQDRFYLLEEPQVPAANKMVTALDQELSVHYQPFCRSKFIRTQVIGFAKSAATRPGFSDWASLPACGASTQLPR